MNGRRAKALKAKFRELHGRPPAEAIKGMRDQAESKVDRDGVRRWHNAFEEHGLLIHIESMKVLQQSEVRLLKKAYNATA